MKNLHIIQINKPSRLRYTNGGNYALSKKHLSWRFSHHIYITSDEEIKGGDWCINVIDNKVLKIRSIHSLGISLVEDIYGNMLETYTKDCIKIILTTDHDLIIDGVQAIDDLFLEWFVQNSICEEIEVKKEMYMPFDGKVAFELSLDPKLNTRPYYKIIIPREETKKESFTECDERQAERMYSEEEVINLLNFVSKEYNITNDNGWFHRHGSIFDVSSKELLEIWKNKNKKK